MKIKKSRNKLKTLLILVMLVAIVTVGYALLSTTLNINGTTQIANSKWIIYFDKLENESGVHSNNTNINSNKDTVSFDIVIENPGDYYEFDVDTVNDGTIDAIIDSVELTGIPDELQDILTFDVVYKGTNIPVSRCDMLKKNSRKNLTVRLSYLKDIESTEIIEDETDLELKFKINYVQEAVCDNNTPTADPRLTINPNGGIYNETTEPTTITLEKNVETEITPPTREGYTFKYYTLNNIPLEKEENGKTKLSISEDTTIIAEWENNTPVTTYTVTINPNGGVYNNTTENTVLTKVEGDTVTLTNPTKEGYVFAGWEEVTETTALVGSVITVGTTNIEVKAKWTSMDDMVAKIVDQTTHEDKFYPTIQQAFDDAITNDTVILLKNVTQSGTAQGTKKFAFDLNSYTVTGIIVISTNTELTIDNGRIENITSTPVINNGTLNVGTKGGEMLIDSIEIYGGSTVDGLAQNGTFNFYDGHIIGKTAVQEAENVDLYNELEEGYYFIVDHNETLNYQKAYLSDNIDAIVRRDIGHNKNIYYKLLQDAIDATSNNNPYIYAIKDFETSKTVEIPMDKKVVFDVEGYNVDEGAKITNNGELTITNTKDTGSMLVREVISNNATLNITTIALTQPDTSKNLIENSGDLNITSSTLTAQNGYALDIKAGGNLAFDNETTITANNYGIYNEAQEAVTVTGGDIFGVYNAGTSLKISNSNISNRNAHSIYTTTGDVTLENLTVSVTYGSNRALSITGGKVTINGGTYTASGSANASQTIINSGTLEINDVQITGNRGCISSSNKLTINNSTITGNDYSSAVYISDGTMDYNDSTIQTYGSSSYGVYAASGVININSGSITTNSAFAIKGYSGASVIINGGTITSINQTALDCYRGYFEINGGLITSKNSYAFDVGDHRGSAKINGGTLISEESVAIHSNAYLTITGGTAIGKVYGLQTIGATTTIGVNDGEVSTTSPVLRGESYGLYISGGEVKFYDGILEGKVDGYYGTFDTIASKHDLYYDTAEIDEETYNTVYLLRKIDYLQVGENTFSSLQDAIDSIESTGTIEVIADANENEYATIPASKTITYDLNGHKVTSIRTITNNGNLTLINSNDNENSNYTTTNQNMITNNKKLTVESGKYYSNKNVIFQDSSASSTIVNGGYLKSTSSTTIQKNGGSLTIEDGELTTGGGLVIYGYTIVNGGYLHATSDVISYGAQVNGGKIESISGTGIITNDYQTTVVTAGEISSVSGNGVYGSINMSGGTITSQTSTAYQCRKTAIISGGTISSVDGNAIGTYNNDLTISGGTITSVNRHALETDFFSKQVITGGTLTSENNTAIYLPEGRTLKIEGGHIKGKTYGVQLNNSSFNLIIGKEGSGVDTTSPVIIGDTQGLIVNSGIFEFYDGIIKGISNSYTGTVSKIEDSYKVKYDTEVIEGVTYKTSYLEPEADFLQVGDTTYNSLPKAINAIEDTGTIVVIDDKVMKTAATIPSSKNITFDLNGHNITTSQTLTNNGILTLEDSQGTGKFTSTNSSQAVANTKTLNVISGNYEASSTLFSQNSGATINISGGNMKATGDLISSYPGTVNITGGNFTGYSYDGMYLRDTTTTISNASINTTQDAFYLMDGTFIISDSEITSNFGIRGNSTKITVTNTNITTNSTAISGNRKIIINSGTFIAKNDCAVSGDDLEIYGGKFQGASYGLENSGTAIIGTNDSSISTTAPEFIGGTYGIRTERNTIKFYDGVIKGRTAPCDADITIIPDNTTFYRGTEVINDKTYNIEYLITQPEFIENTTTNTRYSNLQTAFDEANDNDTLKLINDVNIHYTTTISNKKINIDLNNHTMNLIKKITNEGEVVIDDNSTEKNNLIRTSADIQIITNKNKLTISNTKVNTTASGQYAIGSTTTGSVLSLNNVTINATCGINTSSELNINNTSITTPKCPAVANDNGTVNITNNSVLNMTSSDYISGGSQTLYNYNGVINIENSKIASRARNTSSYYNNVNNSEVSKSTIKDSQLIANSSDEMRSIVNNAGKIEVEDSTMGSSFYNNGNLKITDTDINNLNRSSENNGTVEINGHSVTGNGFINNGTLTINGVTLSNNQDSDFTYIDNKKNLTLNNSTISVGSNGRDAIVINNSTTSSALTINSTDITVDYTRSSIIGIRNSGTINYNSGTLKVNNTVTGYGIYTSSGTVNLSEAIIDIAGKNTYGIYMTNGTVNVGELEDPINVSTTTPQIKAVGTTTGIGVKKTDGILNYYDGEIIGSTNAKPEAPTDIPTRYRVVFTRDTDTYEHCVLEYVPE